MVAEKNKTAKAGAEDPRNELSRVVRDAIETGRYLVGITIMREGGKLDHFVSWRNFPIEDVFRSHYQVKLLIENKLEHGETMREENPEDGRD